MLSETFSTADSLCSFSYCELGKNSRLFIFLILCHTLWETLVLLRFQVSEQICGCANVAQERLRFDALQTPLWSAENRAPDLSFERLMTYPSQNGHSLLLCTSNISILADYVHLTVWHSWFQVFWHNSFCFSFQSGFAGIAVGAAMVSQAVLGNHRIDDITRWLINCIHSGVLKIWNQLKVIGLYDR